MKVLISILVVLISTIILSSCNVTRNLPEDSYLVQKVIVETDKDAPKEERIKAEDIEKYIQQKRNKRFLGMNFYVEVYNFANPNKDNWWNNLKRKIGEEPVLYNNDLTEKSAENIKTDLYSRGYFAADVKYSVDTTSRRKRAKVKYSFKQNKPYIIDSISYDFKDRFLEPILLADTVNRKIHTGDIFNIATLDEERERITLMLRNRGYYKFSVNNIAYIADTLERQNRVGITMIVKQNLLEYNSRGEAIYDNNAVYRLRDVSVIPAYNAVADKASNKYMASLDSTNYNGLEVLFNGRRPYIRPKVLRPTIPLYSGAIYNDALVQRTYSNLLQMGFKSARIVFSDATDSLPDSRRYLTYVGGKDSVSLNYTSEQYLDCKILCTPSLRQSIKAELEGSTTSSFYGVKATLGYQNRNVFRGAELMEITGTVGYELMKAPDANRRSAIELGLSAGLSFPRVLIFRTSAVCIFVLRSSAST